MSAATAEELEPLRAKLVGEREVRFNDLIGDHRDAAVDLAAFIEELTRVIVVHH